jgi:hypothetical protein
VKEAWVSKRGGLLPARLTVAIAALAGIALTPPFALAYEEAYGAGGAAGLLPAGAAGWLFEHGLLGGDSEAVYDRYGIAYLVALGLMTASLVVLARPVRGGRRVILVGLVVLCVGVFGDYVVPNDVVGGVGFLLQGIGLLVAGVGVGLLVRRNAGGLAGAGAALGTLACMFAGGALTGHIPSGPGLTILVGALAFALFARGVERDGADVLDTHTALP